MNGYKGITFAKDYNKSFAEFKDEFGSTHIFNNIHPNEREKELKKAYKIATSRLITKEDLLTDEVLAEIEVNKAKILKPNGNSSRTTHKSKEADTK